MVVGIWVVPIGNTTVYVKVSAWKVDKFSPLRAIACNALLFDFSKRKLRRYVVVVPFAAVTSMRVVPSKPPSMSLIVWYWSPAVHVILGNCVVPTGNEIVYANLSAAKPFRSTPSN